jgi:hypothetical protein
VSMIASCYSASLSRVTDLRSVVKSDILYSIRPIGRSNTMCYFVFEHSGHSVTDRNLIQCATGGQHGARRYRCLETQKLDSNNKHKLLSWMTNPGSKFFATFPS